MKNYLELAQKILDKGSDRMDRTGVGCRSLFGEQLRFDLSKGFPLVTTKKVFWKGIVVELLWMLSGSTNVKPLQEQGVHIWDEWADKNGDLGPAYGSQWRKWYDSASIWYDYQEHVDQIEVLVKNLKKDPYSRRHLVSAWNVEELPQMRLPPCHFAFQCMVTNDKLNLQMFQRSCDVFLGLPFNIGSYALLTHMLAQVVGLQVGELSICITDAHLYHNHFDQIKEQIKRQPRPLPWLSLNPEVKDIDSFKREDIELLDYNPWPPIKAEVAV